MVKPRNPLFGGDFGQYVNRKKGKVKRRITTPQELSLSEAKHKLAEHMADMFEVPDEIASRYMDWYASLAAGIIDEATFVKETGQPVHPPKFDSHPQ